MKNIVFLFLIIGSNLYAYVGLVNKSDDIFKMLLQSKKIHSVNLFKKELFKTPSIIKNGQYGLSNHQKNTLLIEVALDRGMIQKSKQLYYLNSFKNTKNGDDILIKAIEQNKNLDLVLMKHKAKVVSNTTLKRTKTKVYGLVNDQRFYSVIGKNGKNIGRFKPTDFYDTNKIIKLPSQMFNKNTTSTGYQRNSTKYWKEYRKLYYKDLSPLNIKLIRDGKSPKVDNTWLKAYPNHKHFKGETLQHHHLHHGGNVVPLPSSLHIGNNYKIFHTLEPKN